MSAVLIQKKVLFCGIWKPSSRASNDALLRQISAQFLEKKSLVANYQLCEDGLRLQVIQENGRQGSRKSEKIPFTGIQDISVNRYNPICLMTIYVDAQRRSNYLVCRCESERDVSQIVLTFRDHKISLVGEGYKIDFVKPQGTNWMLMPKQDNGQMNGHSEMSSDSGDNVDGGRRREVVNGMQNGVAGPEHHVKVAVATETFERVPCEIEGRPGFSVAVQTNFGELDSDGESMMSSTSYRSLKDELLTLSQEIREIKFLLEKTTGISAAEYFKKDINPNRHDQRKYVSIPVEEQDLPSPTDSANSADKRVNFNMPDHDIRSFGIQTEKGQRKGYYTKRPGRSDVRAIHVRGNARHRSSSSSSLPRSPGSIGRSGGNDVFDAPSQGRAVYIRGSEQHGKSGYTTTIERPIEEVYNVYSRNFRSPRKKIVVMPTGHATMPALRRPKSASYSSSMNDFEDTQAF